MTVTRQGWLIGLLTLTFVSAALALPRTMLEKVSLNVDDDSHLDPAPLLGSVVIANGDFRFISGEVEGAVASGAYIDGNLTASNFGKLRVQTSGDYSDRDQMSAAGYLEGWLTAERIFDYYTNTHTYFQKGMNVSLEKPLEWLEENERWVREQAPLRAPESEFWATLQLLLAQFDGMVQGYRDRAVRDGLPEMNDRNFTFVNGNGELYDIIDGIKAHATPVHEWVDAQWVDDSLSGDELRNKLAFSGHCSALIKVTGDLSDLLMGHSTWDTFSSAVRIYKHYHFALAAPAIKSQRLSFSSYPGELFSDDDLYMMDSQMVVLSTTNHIFNTSLFKLLDTKSVVSWQRVRIANMLATSGREWTDILATHNSGTYNNQYMVVDLKKFSPGQDLRPDLLWVAEQIPGLVARADVTETLSRGYWPSYNVAYFPEVYHRSGYKAFQAVHAARGTQYLKAVNWVSYQVTPRAMVFRRDNTNVTDLRSMKRMMRYNDYKGDPYSQGDSAASVCGRGDLDPKHPDARGCYDSKVTNYRMALQLEAEVVNGPTTENGLPPFRWSSKFANVPHQGQPKKFDFDYELQTPLFDRAGAHSEL